MRLAMPLLFGVGAGLPPLVVTPSTTQSTVARLPIVFTASGGTGSFALSIPTNNSGGSAGAFSGGSATYTPGPTGNVDDVVRVSDGVSHVDVTVHVWSPLNFSTSPLLKRWYAEQTAVATWTDETGASNLTQGTGGNQPTTTTINTHNALNFNGAHADFMADSSANVALNAGGVVFGVILLSALTTAIGVGGAILAKSFNSLAWWLGADWNANSGKVTWGHAITTAGKFARSDSALNDGLLHRLIGTYDGTTYTLYVDGVAQATVGTDGTYIDTGADKVQVGSASPTGSAAFGAATGKLGNVGAVSGTVTGAIGNAATDLGKLDLYLKTWAGM